MAQRLHPITLLIGAASAALILFLTLGTLGAVIWRAEGGASLRASDWGAIWFTIWQAFLSAALSLALAIPVSRALARRQFPGRGPLIVLLGAPFILPVIVAILGLTAVFGRNGLLGQAAVFFGLEPLSIYGWHGVILAHVFFNLPLATRLLLQGWQAIPAERYRAAASLGFSGRDMFRHIEWPVLAKLGPGIFAVIFVICTTSFAVALALGGGPKATTIELAIYQAFRFDFDLAKAAVLSIWQFGLCAVAALAMVWLYAPSSQGVGLDRALDRWDGWRWLDIAAIGLASLFLLVPLAMIVLAGLPGLLELSSVVWAAALRSLLVAVVSAILTILLALSIASLVQRLFPQLELLGFLAIAASPLVMGTGLFILTFSWVDPALLALPITIVVNAAMSLPFALRAILPALADLERDYGRLSHSLGMQGWSYLRWVVLPRLRRPIGFAAGLAAALSMGDLGVITLFANPEVETLPLLIYRLMTAYRIEEARAAALILLGLSLLAFWVLDKGGRSNAAV